MHDYGYGKMERFDSGLVKIWDTKTYDLVKTIEDENWSVWSVAISPNGKYIASSSFKDIKIWDANNGKLLLTIVLFKDGK